MKDYIGVGSCPPEETAAQVDEGEEKMRAQCAHYIRDLRNWMGPEPEGARLSTKGFPHDFGTYYEVVCWYDDALPESLDYALRCEGEGPTRWIETTLIDGATGVKTVRLVDGSEHVRTTLDE